MTEKTLAADDVIAGNETPVFAVTEIPSKKPMEDFSAAERRADIARIITDLGHPSMVNQSELAERYGVSQPQISKDIDAIAEYAEQSLGDRHELEIGSVFRRSLEGLLNEGEWRKAARTAKDYSEWMTERSDIAEIREQLELLKQATDTNTDS